MNSPVAKIAASAGVLLLMLLVLPFALHAISLGVSGFPPGPLPDSRFFDPGETVPNTAVAGHMILGGILTFLAPLQLWGGLRTRWPRLHRINGYILFFCAMLTGAMGLVFIALRGTIGGQLMNAGFVLYGLLLIVVAVQTVRHAQARRYKQHQRWALRLVILAIGSWIYRMHYTVWYLMGNVAGEAAGFRSTFDLIQNFAFYLPYLAALQLWFVWHPPRDHQAISTQTSL